MANKTPPKRDVMLALLQAADSVYVNFDPRRDGVLVPPQLKRQPRVVLQYGMNMAIPIPDLDVGEEGIGATLSFDRMPTWTFVPWSAVFAIVSQDQRGMLWEADVPREVQVEQKKQPAPGPTAVPEKPGKTTKSTGSGASKGKRPSLRAVEGGHKKSATDERKGDAPIALKGTAPASPKPTLKIEESRVAPGERPAVPSAVQAPVPSAQSSGEPTVRGEKQNDEIVEPPRQEKKKRELPPYLRVVK